MLYILKSVQKRKKETKMKTGSICNQLEERLLKEFKKEADNSGEPRFHSTIELDFIMEKFIADEWDPYEETMLAVFDHLKWCLKNYFSDLLSMAEITEYATLIAAYMKYFELDEASEMGLA